ncbi:Pancreatic prohormone [Fukomys damarensis]|uniref:Pancreatic prohormone n=1 Tax=Fukomys damarensis TaxID=885580 RepID=A0A091D4W7_FUKDA|nr:Pancreatic prohormone [Fukomys damarensis]
MRLLAAEQPAAIALAVTSGPCVGPSQPAAQTAILKTTGMHGETHKIPRKLSKRCSTPSEGAYFRNSLGCTLPLVLARFLPESLVPTLAPHPAEAGAGRGSGKRTGTPHPPGGRADAGVAFSCVAASGAPTLSGQSQPRPYAPEQRQGPQVPQAEERALVRPAAPECEMTATHRCLLLLLLGTCVALLLPGAQGAPREPVYPGDAATPQQMAQYATEMRRYINMLTRPRYGKSAEDDVLGFLGWHLPHTSAPGLQTLFSGRWSDAGVLESLLASLRAASSPGSGSCAEPHRDPALGEAEELSLHDPRPRAQPRLLPPHVALVMGQWEWAAGTGAIRASPGRRLQGDRAWVLSAIPEGRTQRRALADLTMPVAATNSESAMQQVLDNLGSLPSATGAAELDLIFLRGIMESPIVRSLAKGSTEEPFVSSRLFGCLHAVLGVCLGSVEADLRRTVEESGRIQRGYGHYFDLTLVNSNLDRTFRELQAAMDKLRTEPQWVPVSWVY